MHDLKIGRLELFWWIDFNEWGVAVTVSRTPKGLVPRMWGVGAQFGPLNLGAFRAD